MRKRPFLHKKSGFSAYFVQPSEALLAMPPGGCAGLAGAAVYLSARARRPRRDDRQRAAGRPRPRERRERRRVMGIAQVARVALRVGDRRSARLPAESTPPASGFRTA